ncbi:IPT/TIG domain-containing protein, partial [Streptomyces sp. NPDC056358]
MESPDSSIPHVTQPPVVTAAPAGAGTVRTTATAPHGTDDGADFTLVLAAPTIGSVVPNQGSVDGGNTVTLTGTGFTGATSV